MHSSRYSPSSFDQPPPISNQRSFIDPVRAIEAVVGADGDGHGVDEGGKVVRYRKGNVTGE